MEANHKLMAASDDYIASNNQIQRYQSMVGGLMWAATQSRPDISYATSVLARYLRKPTDEHTNAAKRVLCYLKGTRKHGLTFTGTGVDDLNLQGFTDASWGDDIDSRRSTGGYVYKLCGGPISWKSGRQSIVTLSSTEAEFVSLTVAAKEAAAISRLLKEIMLYQGPAEPVPLLEDNQPAIDLTKRPLSDGRTKHIDIRWCYIQQQVNKGAVKVSWISTNDQAADGLTKALNRVKFARFKELIGVMDCASAIKSAATSTKKGVS
jgi:hypothetical protein